MIFKSIDLFKHIQNSSELIVWEKLFIQKYKLRAMNFDIPSEKNLISKYKKFYTEDNQERLKSSREHSMRRMTLETNPNI